MLMPLAASIGGAQEPADSPNHHLHNFDVSERTFEHAVAMGYRLVPSSGNVNRNVRRRPPHAEGLRSRQVGRI
jgi:hypothetical protein